MKFNQELTLLPNLGTRFSPHYVEKSIHELTYQEDLSTEKEDVYEADFNEESIIIDLDKLEIAIAKKYRRNRRNSMDLSFAISDITKENSEIVLVEYRLNYRITCNLIKVDLDNKVKFSRRYTKFFYNIPIHKKKYFIFQSKLVPEFRRRLMRMNPACSPEYVACSIQDISDKFFK